MQYQEAVAESHRLDQIIEEAEATAEGAKWRQAELTHEQVRKNGITQRQWAADIGKDHRTIGRWAEMWERWGGLALPQRPSFYEATEFVRAPGLYETIEDVKGGRHHAQAKVAVRNMPPEEKAAVVREALDDPDVAVRTMRDSHTRRNVSDARQRVADEIETDARDREQASPTQREIARTTEHFAVGDHLRLARFHAAEATRQLQEIDVRDDGMVAGFARDVEEIREALDWFDTAVSGGQVDDDALAKFIEGGTA